VAGVFALTCYAIGGTYGWLLAGAIFEGLGRAIYSGNNDALLYDTLAKTDKRELFQPYLGRTSSMYQFALVTTVLLSTIPMALYWRILRPRTAALVQAATLPACAGAAARTAAPRQRPPPPSHPP
jgi:hypothetical protein